MNRYITLVADWHIDEDRYDDVHSIIETLRSYYSLEKQGNTYKNCVCKVIDLLTLNMLSVILFIFSKYTQTSTGRSYTVGTHGVFE